jgi:hypothetical protein
MSNQPPEQQNFQISMPESMAGGVWANFASVSHSPYEFTIDFIRMDFAHAEGGPAGSTVPGSVVARVNLSPLFVTQLMDALKANWTSYARQSMPPEVYDDGSSD